MYSVEHLTEGIGEILHVVREAAFETKTEAKNRADVGSRRAVIVAGHWSIRDDEWDDDGYAHADRCREPRNHPVEEEISDVSLATFYVLDKESYGAFRPGRRFAMGGTCAGCGGCGCWTGNSYSAPVPGSHTGAPHNAVHVHKDERNPRKP
jgi:hypothetical protein